MKIMFFWLLLPLVAYTQSSFPNSATDPLWLVGAGNFFGNPYTANYTLGSDVVLYGKHFEEILISFPPDTQTRVEGYVRTEGKKVYIVTLDPFNARALSKEKLMYDFSLEVNKKIYCAAFSLDNPADSTLCWAVSTDSVVYRGIKRKTWNMWYSEWTPTGDPPQAAFTTWIEGVGSTTQPFFPLYCMSQGCEISSHIVCFHESNQLKFLNPYYESCDSLISTNTKDIISKTDVKLYPSLASHQLTIENSNISNLRIDITNSLGQLFISKQIDIGANTIDITSLTSGIYFALISDGHKRRVDKFIKN